jgi:hypothetical protein
MSPKATTVVSERRASAIAANTSSSRQTQTGHPGPEISSTASGSVLRSPAIEMVRSCPPQTFITRTRPRKGSAWMREVLLRDAYPAGSW